MSKSWFKPTLKGKARSTRRKQKAGRYSPALECLEDRLVLSVTASFAAATGVLTVTGDQHNNTIAVGRDTAGHININGGAIPIAGGAPTVANTALIQVFGL